MKIDSKEVLDVIHGERFELSAQFGVWSLEGLQNCITATRTVLPDPKVILDAVEGLDEHDRHAVEDVEHFARILNETVYVLYAIKSLRLEVAEPAMDEVLNILGLSAFVTIGNAITHLYTAYFTAKAVVDAQLEAQEVPEKSLLVLQSNLEMFLASVRDEINPWYLADIKIISALDSGLRKEEEVDRFYDYDVKELKVLERHMIIIDILLSHVSSIMDNPEFQFLGVFDVTLIDWAEILDQLIERTIETSKEISEVEPGSVDDILEKMRQV